LARTQSADYDKRLVLITDTAAELYAKRGFLGTSVAELSAACNMSKSLVYHYFPAKEDILFAVMWGHVSALVEVARGISAADAPPEALLRRLADELMAAYSEAQAAQKILLNELDNLPPDKRALVVQAQREVLDTVDKLLVALRPHLAAQPPQRRPIVMMFFGMLNWTHIWFNRGGPVSAQDIASLAADMWLGGLPGPEEKNEPRF